MVSFVEPELAAESEELTQEVWPMSAVRLPLIGLILEVGYDFIRS